MTLIIETCTERGVVALAEGNTIIKQEELPFGYHNSKNLMPVIDRILGDSKPERIIVGVGPGSYTGIRIGAVTAKTFSFAWDIPIYTVCTLQAFEPVPIIDAKISGAYLMLPGGEPQVCPLEKLGDVLTDVETLVTPNAGRLREKVEALYLGKWQWEEKAPDPGLMLLAAEGTPALRHDQMKLLYLRKTQAELERKSSDMVNS